jgi:energy-coupling factor transporter transmembrane protein EcfT
MHNRIRKLTKLKSKEIRECSELRLYDVRKKRTNYRPIKVGFYDIFFLLFHISLIFVFLISEELI